MAKFKPGDRVELTDVPTLVGYYGTITRSEDADGFVLVIWDDAPPGGEEEDEVSVDAIKLIKK